MKKMRIMVRMADLREQSKVVRVIYSQQCERPTRDNLERFFSENPVFNDDKKTVEANDKRIRRIKTLIRSCEEDRFIETVSENKIEVDIKKMRNGRSMLNFSEPYELPTVERTYDRGFFATSKGTDLLNPLGFCTAFLGKHGFIAGIVISTTGWILLNVGSMAYNLWVYGNVS